MDLKFLESALQTHFLGRKILHFPKITSTQDKAFELCSKGYPEGTLIVADIQTKARGRFKRKWVSPEGGLWFSLILKLNNKSFKGAGLLLLSALAAVKVLQAKGIDTCIKWPNDIIIKNKKVCGILAESYKANTSKYFIILGLGINLEVNTELLPPNAGSIYDLTGIRIQKEDFLKGYLESFEDFYLEYKTEGLIPFLEELRKNSCILGKMVKIDKIDFTLSGKAVDFDGDGSLIIQLSDKSLAKITSGDLSVLY